MQWSGFVCSILLAVLTVGCSDQETTQEVGKGDDVPATTAPVKAGGYEPTKDERVPGITMSQQELDKIYQESHRSAPLDITPENPQ